MALARNNEPTSAASIGVEVKIRLVKAMPRRLRMIIGRFGDANKLSVVQSGIIVNFVGFHWGGVCWILIG